MTQAATRTAAVTLLGDYATDAGIGLQVYRARPGSIRPPTAFVDTVGESIEYVGHLMQRTPRVEVVICHGLFDTGDAADRKDAFVDGFIAWVRDRIHAAGANTQLQVVDTEDVPNFVPEWLPPGEPAPNTQRTYYASRITLEGYAES
jgi:hypothetical protein